VDMPDLHKPCIDQERTAEKAERYPQRTTCSRIEATPWHERKL
jgi:hypothetical protein